MYELVRIVTPEQLGAGYLELIGDDVIARRYVVLEALPNGNFAVIDPANSAHKDARRGGSGPGGLA